MRDEFEEDELDEEAVLGGDDSLLDDEDGEFGLDDEEDEEDPLKHGFTVDEKEDEFGF